MKRILALILAVSSVMTPSARRFDGRDRGEGDKPLPIENPIAQLNRKIQAGAARLEFDSDLGYLPSVLKALDVPIESQIVVFSKGSLQGNRISPTNPRTLFFNDSLVVAWVWGGFLEFAVQDHDQGVHFYTLGENEVDATPFKRRNRNCVSCHRSSLGGPEMFTRSDHRSPIRERWRGWYVTGRSVPAHHRGNTVMSNTTRAGSETPKLETLSATLHANRYLSHYSDVVALLVFDHQMEMMNLLTRIERQYRLASYVEEFVDYLLFVDEAPLPGKIQGTSGFAERFAAKGPRDGQGRSLREFDLNRRLMRYPCSYMIYSPPFESLSREAKDAVYRRMWEILSGEDTNRKYAKLSLSDRQAVIEILRDTKSDLPNYFKTSGPVAILSASR